MRKVAIDLIFEICKEPNAFDKLEKHLEGTTRKKLSENIIECGILPEMFDHDSSEEKLWAKYSDIMLALSLTYIGIPSKVIRTRGDSADVMGQTKGYSIVGDAKTFRLSRTAKNQKDFKVKALDDWRRQNDYAVLVCPLAQYPNRRSQIYFQAVERNVTLLSYTHLSFLLDHQSKQSLAPLWEAGKYLKKSLKPSEFYNSQSYWQAIDDTVCRILGESERTLKEYKKAEIDKTREIGNEGIRFWENRIKQYQSLTKDQAVKKLIKAEKIEAKIDTIRKAISQEFEL